MAKENTASSSGQLFAHKGTAQPASGLRAIYPKAEYDGEPQARAVPVKSSDSAKFAAADGELQDAASLQVGGFKTAGLHKPAPPTPEAVAPETVAPETDAVTPEDRKSTFAAAGPADIETALAEVADRSTETAPTQTAGIFVRNGILRQLIVGAGFAALLLASLGIGYGISVFVRGGSTGDGVVAPVDEIRQAAPVATPEEM